MRLPVEQRAAVVAVDMQGYSVAETARMLGVAEGTVKSRCSRARAQAGRGARILQRGAAADRGSECPGNRDGSAPSNRPWWRLACVRAWHNRRGQRWTTTRATTRSITPELLADLQAGLLDDATAAALRRTCTRRPRRRRHAGRPRPGPPRSGRTRRRRRLRTRRPAAVTARVGAALHAQPPHDGQAGRRIRSAHLRWQLVALVAGVGAAVMGVVLGGLMLAREPAPTRSSRPTAKQHHGVAAANRAPAAGAADRRPAVPQPPTTARSRTPQRRASCLSGLGYSVGDTRCSGARPLDMHGQPAVLMLLPGDTPEAVLRAGRRARLQLGSHRPVWPIRWSPSVICPARRRGTPRHTLVFVLVPT